ncbi:MAG: HPr kinase/phosphatase C-terminal domain-containing protein [Pseudomonadota bacterium]
MTEGPFQRGTAVAIDGRGLLILGPSGAGKSALALDLIAMGAILIADDVVRIERIGDQLVMSVPDTGRGVIEARGIGLLRTPAAGPTRLTLALDLGEREDTRLPAPLRWTRQGLSAPLLRRPSALQPAAIRAAVLSGGPIDPDMPLVSGQVARDEARDQCRAARDSRAAG